MHLVRSTCHARDDRCSCERRRERIMVCEPEWLTPKPVLSPKVLSKGRVPWYWLHLWRHRLIAASIVPSCVALASYTPQVNNFSRLKDGLYDFQPVHLHSHTVMRPWPRLCSDIAAIRCQKHKQARQLSHVQGGWRCSIDVPTNHQQHP